MRGSEDAHGKAAQRRTDLSQRHQQKGNAVSKSIVNEETRDELDQLREDLKAVRADLAALGKDLVSVTKSGAASASEAARDEARKRLEQLTDAWDDAKDSTRAAKRDVERTIEDHPFASVMIALGVGVVVGKLLDRR